MTKHILTGCVRRVARLTAVAIVGCALGYPATCPVVAQEYANDPTVGIEPKLGETIPLDLTFNNEEGKPITLRSLVKRPTVFVLVYLRCPGICSPLMHEVAATVDKLDLTPGIDYDLITVSFDARETADLARTAKKNLLGEMKRKIPPDSWHFLTGDETNIAKLTDAFGYRFHRDKEDFAHPGTIMFVSPKGVIVRYLPGLKILPTHMKMAIQDAAEGHPRSFMQTIQRLCYAYDPSGKTYIVKVNRIILAVSLVTLGVFVGYLFTFGKKRTPQDANVPTSTEEEIAPMATNTGAPAIDPHADYIHAAKGLRSWLTTTDHKRIGIMYLIMIVTFFFFGATLGLLMRLELIAPGKQFLSNGAYNRILTLHGITMIFLFIIPSIPAVFGNFFLPIMVGANDVAFPRLNLASWYFYAVGGLFAIISVGLGGPDTGWTFYVPYTATTQANVLIPILAAFILGWSSILTGLNFIVTVHRLRAPGMWWSRLPLFVWGLYATSWIQIVATPVIAITLLLVLMERFLHIPIFDPSIGGDPILYQHLFWIYSHPAVYIMVLPAMGVVSEVVPVFSRKTIFGYKFIAVSSMAIAAIGSLVWRTTCSLREWPIWHASCSRC